MQTRNPNKIIGARNGSPLIIGIGDKENFIASDIQALIKHTDKFVYLEDGDLVTITSEEVKIFDKNKKNIRRETKKSSLTSNSNSKGDFDHFMLKEIFEQPEAVKSTIQDRIINNFEMVSGHMTYPNRADRDMVHGVMKEVILKAENDY